MTQPRVMGYAPPQSALDAPVRSEILRTPAYGVVRPVPVVRAYKRLSRARASLGETKAEAEIRLRQEDHYQSRSCRDLARLHGRGLKFVEYTEVISSKVKDRPERDRMMRDCNPGDIIVADSLSRLQRDTYDALEWWKLCKARGVTFYVREGALTNDQDSPTSELLFSILSAVDKFMRDQFRDRMGEVQRNARANGKHIGRPQKITPTVVESILADVEEGMSCRQAAIKRNLNPGSVRWAIRHRHGDFLRSRRVNSAQFGAVDESTVEAATDDAYAF